MEQVKDFSIKGAKYEVSNAILKLGDGKFISNEFLDNKNISINLKSGKILIIYSKD